VTKKIPKEQRPLGWENGYNNHEIKMDFSLKSTHVYKLKHEG
jgi:hypothetical protein